MLDILIKNGTVIDGTGSPGVLADVGVKGGEINAVGKLAEAKAKTVIDAAGRYVTPGFIDVTNHSDATAGIFQHPTLPSLVTQGITTVIAGNCGISLAPLTDPDIIHGIRKWSENIVNVNWLSTGEYLSEVEKLRLATNFATFVGHGTIRRGITNEALRPLLLEELAKFKFVLGEALDQGALGLSTNLGASHEHHAGTDELIEIAKVLAAKGGVYKTHLRNEGAELIPALNEALRIGDEAGVPVSISHLKGAGRKAWPLIPRALSMMESAASSGRAAYDVTPYARTGSQLHMLLPAWAREGGFREMLVRLKDPAVKLNIIRELQMATLHYDRIRVAEAGDGVSPGKTLAEIAERMEVEPAAALVELLSANRGRVSILGKTLSKKNVVLQVRAKHSMIATNGSAWPLEQNTPSFPHPRSFGSFTRFLRHYARDAKAFSWEEAIQKITHYPAAFFGLKGRGSIQKGQAADIVVFNPETVRDRATYANPWHASEGIDWVVVNGVPVLREGSITGERPGAVIRKA